MGQSLIIDRAENGGFPEPLAGVPVRVVAARHSGCGTQTRVRVPGSVPARAVRRVHCIGCDQDFETDAVEELGPPPRPPGKRSLFGLSKPGPSGISLPGLDPSSRVWQLASIPLAAALVIGGLLVIQGGSDESDAPQGQALDAAAVEGSTESGKASGSGDRAERVSSGNGDGIGKFGKPAKNTELVQGSSFHLALPKGWERIDPPAGATFAAVAAAGDADATLWIEEKPGLDFPSFIGRSLKQLEALAGSARIVERVPAPTPDDTIVRLAANAPAGQPTYEVLLRASGAYRYYLATSVQPDASREAVDGVDLISGSFTPEGGV